MPLVCTSRHVKKELNNIVKELRGRRKEIEKKILAVKPRTRAAFNLIVQSECLGLVIKRIQTIPAK